MDNAVYEVVIYSANEATVADEARADIQTRVQALPGFRSYLPLTDVNDPTRRADVVQCASHEAAKAAAEAVNNHEDFSPFVSTVTSLIMMGHFRAQWGTATSKPGAGVEISFFRLKRGVTEFQARTAHAKAVDGFLSRQQGWITEHFVQFDDGLYLDLLLAESRERAEAICGLWHHHPDCTAFVALVEDVDMKFGRVI